MQTISFLCKGCVDIRVCSLCSVWFPVLFICAFGYSQSPVKGRWKALPNIVLILDNIRLCSHWYLLRLRKVQHGNGTVDIVPNYVICPFLNSFSTDFLHSLVTTWLHIISLTLQVSLLAICLWVTSCFSYFASFFMFCPAMSTVTRVDGSPCVFVHSCSVPDTSGVRSNYVSPLLKSEILEVWIEEEF